MNRKFLLIVCLLLVLHIQKSTAQEGEKLTCHVTSATFKIRQADGSWSDWRPYNTGSEQKDVNIIFDFGKMSMYWVSQNKGTANVADPGITLYRITKLTHDTTHKQFGFYNIKITCSDTKNYETDYELISLTNESCYTLMLVSTDEKFITRRKLEIVK